MCRAIFNNDTKDVEELAGFLAQVNLAEIAHSLAAKDLPKSGLLSFFAFQDIENDDSDTIGAKVLYFPDATDFVRTRPPEYLTEGNEVIAAAPLIFMETLDLPETSSGPWSDDFDLKPDTNYGAVLDYFRDLNFNNLLGYARATTGEDPTPSKAYRHLILLENSVGCRLHIQISARPRDAQLRRD